MSGPVATDTLSRHQQGRTLYPKAGHRQDVNSGKRRASDTCTAFSKQPVVVQQQGAATAPPTADSI